MAASGTYILQHPFTASPQAHITRIPTELHWMIFEYMLPTNHDPDIAYKLVHKLSHVPKRRGNHDLDRLARTCYELRVYLDGWAESW